MKYNVILADPPWKYSGNMPYRVKGGYIQGKNSKSENHYDCMTEEELSKLPIMKLCGDEVVLFMWTTGPKMDMAIRVAEKWGFTYRQMAFVWNKDRICPGCYTITQCEFVLVFGVRGRHLPRRAKTNARQFFTEKPREHSRKPDYVQDMIDLMYPSAKKIELFARRVRQGWDAWGNEVPSAVEL